METQSFAEQTTNLGSRLREERIAGEISIERAAAQLGVPPETITSMESGETAPSLPELELLAYLYRVPLMKILGAASDFEQPVRIKEDKKNAFILLRTRIIGATLKQARMEGGITLEVLSEELDIPQNTLEEYEAGTLPIPQPMLSALCTALGIDLGSLLSPITPKNKSKAAEAKLAELDTELNEFVSNPANLPYLQLAKKLSTFDAAKLREIAENLLEITY